MEKLDLSCEFANGRKLPTSERIARSSNKGTSRRINLIGQAAEQSEESSNWEEDNIVLTLEGNRTPPFALKARINKQPFVTMIDSGSPITIFTKDVRNVLKIDVTFVRPLPKNEEYVDYNGRPLNLLGYITVEVQVGKQIIKKAMMIRARDGKKSLVGRDWLAQLNFQVAEAKQESEYNKNVISSLNKVELSPELKLIQSKSSMIF